MAEESGWQPNYADLSDDRVVRFGGACAVCHARYATAPEPLAAIPPIDREPDPATAQAIEDQKFRLFSAFDSAFRTISIRCFRCGDPACPDCWDVDKQMCGRCVAERGLTRSPHRGEPVEGPLADGFLRRLEPGRYSEVARPSWLKDLLRAQSDPDAARAATLTAGPAPSAHPAPPAGGALPADRAALPPSDLTYPRAPILSTEPFTFEPPPTAKMTSSKASSAPPAFNLNDSLNGPEGEATSGVVECPRCRTPNYDFVTQCTECGLQLIQICPTCEKLNPGHVSQCQHCGAALERPRGWSGVAQPVVPVPPEEGRRRMTDRPLTPRPITPAPQAPGPQAWRSTDAVDEDFASAAPVAPSQRPRPRRPAVLERDREPEPPAALSLAPSPMAARHPYESAGPTFAAAAPVAAPHPYDIAGAPLVPILDQDAVPSLPTRTSMLLGAVGTLVERALTVALLVGLFVVVGAITAAEASPQANQAIFHALHIDIKVQVDHLLTMLHLSGQK